MRKVLKVDELPIGFIYFTETHIVEGTGLNFNEEVKVDERLHQEEGKNLLFHCGYRERSENRKKKTENPIWI